MFLFVCVSIFLLLSAVVYLLRPGKEDEMGGWLSYVWWGGDPDAINLVSGLTKREIYRVQKSWAPINADAVANGTEILKRLFTLYPDTREYFKMVRKLPEEEYTANPQFKAHVVNLMTAINTAVNNLNQPEVVASILNKLGESHGKRKITRKDFVDLEDVVLVNMFKNLLKMDELTLTAWEKTFKFWYKHIFETLDSPTSR